MNHMPLTPPLTARHRMSGFTLVELMVGMVLALLTTVIIAEVMARAEGNRRTTTEGSDAQVNAALSLYTLQRDVQMAGYGLINNPGALGCVVKGQYDTHVTRTFTLAPVVIMAGVDAATSDGVTVLRSGTTGYAVPMLTTGNHASTDSNFSVQSSLGLNAGDLMLALPSAQSGTEWCTLFTVKASGANTLTSTQVPHVAASGTWNPSTSIMPTTYLAGATLAKANDLVFRTFVVANGTLQSLDLQASDDTISTNTLGNNIVLLKAFYGKDTTGDGTVDSYDTTTPTTTADWQQVRTIRLAIVARSAQREKDAVTTANPTLNMGSTVGVAGTADCGTSKCLTLHVSPLTGTDTEWQHYRYKVFDTVVPLRNILWSS